MTFGRFGGQVVGVLLVAALTLFFLESRVDHEPTRLLSDAAQAVTQRDAMLNRDLVLARYGYLAHVDPLVDHMRALRDGEETLRRHVEALPADARDTARLDLADLRRRLAEKAAYIERFKSANAVLHSSIAYFPTAADDVLKELDAGFLAAGRRIAAERATADLMRAVMQNTRPGASGLEAAAESASARLAAAVTGGSATLQQTVEALAAHLAMVVETKGGLDSQLRAALTVPVLDPVQRVGALSAEVLAQAARRAALFQGLLFGTAVLLVVYVAAILARLRAKAADLKRANAELRQEMAGRAEAEDQLAITRKVFDRAVEGVIVADGGGIIQSVNPAFTAITGVEPGEALGRPWGDLTRDSRAESDFPSIWRSAREQGQWQGEVWNTRPDGSEYAVMLTVTSIGDWQGQPRNYVAVFHDITEAKTSADELHFRTYHDPLTGLANRAMVKNRLAMALQLKAPEEKVALVLFDLDNFRTINDGLGHTVGDALLKEVAQRFTEVVDMEAHTIGRLGGDEYALVLRGLTDVQDAVALLRQIFQQLVRPLVLEGHDLYTTASAGVAVHPTDGADAEALFKNADVALNRAKESGRNNFQFYTQDMEAAVFRRLTLEANLRRALKRDEFLLVYQPKVCTRTGAIRGMEALVRWQPPGRAMVSPAEFVPVAEQTGLIVPLGRWILREACAFAESQRRAGFADLTVAVNLSARQFRERTLIDDVAAALALSGLPPANLELEITESMVMEDGEEAIATLRRLKAMGLRVAVDDFGTGYSSLSYLKRFPIDALKIDQSFVRDLTTDADDRAIVRAIISLAASLGLRTVAEGVETAAHLAQLRDGGCDVVQGYLISRPVAAAELASFLRTHADGWRPAGGEAAAAGAATVAGGAGPAGMFPWPTEGAAPPAEGRRVLS